MFPLGTFSFIQTIFHEVCPRRFLDYFDMRKFVANTALFISMPVLAMFFLLLVVEIESQYQYRLDADVDTVVLGDSHIQSALDIAHMEHCINLSINAESTYFSYYRLKELLALNPGIRRVYLGFGCHNISSYYEYFIQGPYSENIASRYFPNLTSKRKNFLPQV